MTLASSASPTARSTETAGALPAGSGYDEDFALWSAEQARLIRAGAFAALDLEHLAEEVEDMGGSLRSEIASRLAVVFEHLLKWEHQPGQRKYGWRSTLSEQRAAIAFLLEDSPSLKRQPALSVPRAYRLGRIRAMGDTGLPERAVPAECPYSIEDALNHAFYPGPEERDVV